ncbi:MAG: phosphoribosylformylglycinamidine synthase subunit PurQ [Alphaproteobacteria bacterium]
MQASVIVFPGANCDRDVQVALRQATGIEPHMVWHRQSHLPKSDLVVVPGGFSYGDYLRCGAMAARSPIMRDVVENAERGVPVLGICNGFQILTEVGLLPGALMTNAGLKFVCRDVCIRVETTDSPFTTGYKAGQMLTIPVAHHDGCYFADDETLDRLDGDGRVAFRYAASTEPGVEPYDDWRRANPNGSARDIAGILSQSRRVLGMMPHPERAADPLLGGRDGSALFAALAGLA